MGFPLGRGFIDPVQVEPIIDAEPKPQPMKDVNPPPALPKPQGKRRFAVLPHEYLLPDCV